MTRLPIYLDYNATTPVALEVADAMQPFLHEAFGNPSSSHAYGRRAHEAVEQARADVAALIGALPNEIIFTGCASEANNLALRGVAHALQPRKRHIVVSAVEHPAVLEPALWLQTQGWEVSVLGVDRTGRVNPADVEKVLRDDTAIVSVMHANNEVGTIQSIATIAAMAHRRGALMHTDAAQSPGKIALNVDDLQVDLLTLAGHKFYATKGVGALYVRRGTVIQPDMRGAGQEHGLRPGTENVPAIIGMGEAARLAAMRLSEQAAHLQLLRDQLHRLLEAAIPGLMLNGDPVRRLPNTLNVSFPRVSGRDLLRIVDADVAASVGSACHSESGQVSGVLAAMGIASQQAMGAVRFSVGRFTTTDEIQRAAQALIASWAQLVPR
ncbi:MAG: cysteine desulfurase family protein [Burkholderiales bacterium]